jgi:hypothetical protein
MDNLYNQDKMCLFPYPYLFWHAQALYPKSETKERKKGIEIVKERKFWLKRKEKKGNFDSKERKRKEIFALILICVKSAYNFCINSQLRQKCMKFSH